MDSQMKNRSAKVPSRILGALLASLSAGVVPRSGAPYVAIGRTDEIAALSAELDRVAEGEGSMRFLVGRYGCGKSFLIQLMRGYACDRGFVCADADLSPERRLSGSGGEGVATYRELIQNMSCKAAPDGGALPVILARWFSDLSSGIAEAGIEVGSEEFSQRMSREIFAVIRSLEAQVGGFDFACVLNEYYRAYESGNEEKMSACLRWIRGEYGTKTEARIATGLRTISIITDDNWYEHIKLLSLLVRKIGYSGFVCFIDEGVNLFKIVNRVAREANYEKILTMFNDTLQGRAEGLMLILGGTPQFMEDPRRGLFGYEALRSRLADGRYSGTEYKSMMGPVIRLRRLSDSELLALVMRLTVLHGQYYKWEPRVTPEEQISFLNIELARAGADEMITPREIIRDYLSLLDLLYQNPDARFSAIASDFAGKSETAKPSPGEIGNHITVEDIEV